MIEENTMVLKLVDPIEYGKDVIEELKLRDLTSKEMRNIPVNIGSMKFGEILDIGQQICEVNRRIIDKLSKKDTLALVERVCFLLEDGA